MKLFPFDKHILGYSKYYGGGGGFYLSILNLGP